MALGCAVGGVWTGELEPMAKGAGMRVSFAIPLGFSIEHFDAAPSSRQFA